jgi:hypothetical protein
MHAIRLRRRVDFGDSRLVRAEHLYDVVFCHHDKVYVELPPSNRTG